jgi:hypothetical protein
MFQSIKILKQMHLVNFSENIKNISFEILISEIINVMI